LLVIGCFWTFVWLPLDCAGSSSFHWTLRPLESADHPLLPDAIAVAVVLDFGGFFSFLALFLYLAQQMLCLTLP
jgi:hypothetical protein